MKILPQIRAPEDVRRLPEDELADLSGEVRAAILETVPHTGGHFASNLGAIELTVALHRCFDTPNERIVFDVGHQAYAHKLLTGRYERFGTLRQRGGLSGFTNRTESPYDAVTAGHSGSALPVAVGMAEAERLAGSGRWTVAVVGDGSFTNGMVYEALNGLADSGLKLCIVLNDNEMSISKNVGGLSRHFSAIRTSQRYFSFKLYAKRFFARIPLVGGGLVRAARGLRDLVKRTTGAETFFEKLGLEYIGPVNGHDVKRLIRVFAEARTKKRPVVVHVVTKKGFGYTDAEAHPERYHSVPPFDPAVGLPPSEPSGFTAAVSRTLCRMAEEDGRIAAVTAAMKDGCGLGAFSERFPDRFFDVGIAEEYAVAMAGGMALSGLKPVLVMYATFSQRVFDQLWHDVALQGAHILLCISHAGLVPGDGVTHQGIYDVALLSRIPGVTIRSPSVPEEIPAALAEAQKDPGIAVVRFPKSGGEEADPGLIWESAPDGSWKRADLTDAALKAEEGNEADQAARRVVVVTYGRIVHDAVRAAKKAFSGTGVRAAVCCLGRIAPLPEDEAFRDLLLGADRLFFIEEGIRSGGIGETLAAADWLGGHPVRIRAASEPFVPHGDLEELKRLSGLDAESLAGWLGEDLPVPPVPQEQIPRS